MQKESTIRELLEKAITAQPYAEALLTKVYTIPGLDNYLLKVEHSSKSIFTTSLKSTTSLTPVYLCDRHVGQRVLSSPKVQIVAKLPGECKSLEALYSEKNQYFSHFLGEKHVLETLNSLPQTSFNTLVEEFNYLTAQGITLDMHRGNILLNTNTKELHLIDFLDTSKNANYFGLCNEFNSLLTACIGNSKFEGKDGLVIENLRDALRKKIDKAVQESAIPKRTAKELTQDAEAGKIRLNTLTPIDTQLGTLNLDAPAHTLRTMLERISTYRPHRQP